MLMKEKTNNTFGTYFKNLRLQAGIPTLKELGNLLAERGYVYEDSALSHWQAGRKVPKNRNVLLTLVSLFKTKTDNIKLNEINKLFESASQGYLTEKEIRELNLSDKYYPSLKLNQSAPFQAPREIDYFTGRKKDIKEAKRHLLLGQTILIQGPAGIGKTTLAIKLAHLLRKEFSDGILWCRVDTSLPSDILNSIAHAYGENITFIKDVNSKASSVRSILSSKNALLILDNVEQDNKLLYLLPNSSNIAVLITSRYHMIPNLSPNRVIAPETFTQQEAINLFQSVLGKGYVEQNNSTLLTASSIFGYLPLAINIFAKYIFHSESSSDAFMQEVKQKKISLDNFNYEDTNLQISLTISYQGLDNQLQKIFASLAIFVGKDFSLQAVAFINNLSLIATANFLQALIKRSLIEHSSKHRYRIHPMVHMFIQKIRSTKNIYKKALQYYIELFNDINKRENRTFELMYQELDNILFIFRKCYRLGYYEEVITFWNHLAWYLWHKGDLETVIELGSLVYKASIKTGNILAQINCSIGEFGWTSYWMGNIDEVIEYGEEALLLAKKINNQYKEAEIKEWLGKIYQSCQRYEESIQVLNEALSFFTTNNDYERIATILRYLGQTYFLQEKYEKGKKLHYRSLEYLRLLKNSNHKSYCQSLVYSHLGAVLLLENKIDEAINLFKLSYEIDKKSRLQTIARIWGQIGLCLAYELKGDMVKSETYYKNAQKEINFFGIGNKIYKTSVFIPLLKKQLKRSSHNFSHLLKGAKKEIKKYNKINYGI